MRSRSLSRRARRFLSAAVVATLFATGSAYGAEPQWIFNNGPDSQRTDVGQGRVVSEFGLFNLIPTGSDLTCKVRMTKDETFDSAEYPFFGLRYKATTKQKIGGIFFTNDDNLKTLSDKSFSPFDVVGDGQWRNLVMDMRKCKHGNWKGVITSFRLDPTNPSDVESTISVSRAGFFKTEADALTFLNAANDEPNLSLETTLSNAMSLCRLPAGSVAPGYNEADYLLDPDSARAVAENELDATSAFVVVSDDKVAPLCGVTSRGFTTYAVATPGKWRLAVRKVDASDLGETSSPADVVFVLARNLMTTDASGAFRPKEKTSADDVARVADMLAPFKDGATLGERIERFEKEFADAQKDGLSREDAAIIIAEGVKTILGVSVASPYPAEYFTRDRLRIGAWGNFRSDDFDDEYMKTYADCGFDFLLAFVSKPTNELLALCDKYGVEATVNDGSFRNPVDGIREYCDHPSFTGCYVVDEPGSDDYDKLAALCNAYEKQTGKRAYVNLLPMYANAAQLKYGAGAAAIEYYDPDPDLFRKYCAAFCEKFDTDYICTDIYPFNWVDGKKVTYSDYAESINVIASVAREYDRDFWCYIQTFGWIKSKRTPNEEEFRWQCYSMLSFGCKTILCWTYAGYNPDFPSLVDTESRKTPAWYDARAVFQELRRLSDVFVQYKNLGAFSHNCSDKTPYLKFSNEYRDFDAIQEIDCPDPLLVGCFESKADAKRKAFTLVNMTEFQDAVGTTVRMKLDAKKVVVWQRGVPMEIAPNAEGWHEFYLGTGEGIFVTLD